MAPQNPTHRLTEAPKPPRRGLGPAGIALLVGLAAFLGFVVWAFFRLWAMAGPTHMSIHGWIAMGLAAVFTVGLGGGLMWLAFYSDRKGYDRPMEWEEEDEP
jgi:hypothetical protein